MGVPLIQQADFYCGPTSLAMVLQWSGSDVTLGEIARQSFTPKARGTYLSDMLGAARRQGQIAVTLNSFGDLLEEIEAGHPVVVFQNLGVGIAPLWHYGVVTGYDLDAKLITLHSGERDVMRMPLAAFLRSWDAGGRWAMVLLPPDQLPVTASEVDLLRAAAALERAGQFDAAEAVYRTGATRWPKNWLWPFGLGNALYAQDDVLGASQSFKEALRRDPSANPARNNLREIQKEMDET
ncbi:MAG: PA2778 family cysteine peptidase [Rhodobacteraceae bacterium]|nr:PA2778 family cysteine peptidase [Paracoccaceae bacterium]